jgi:peptide/nickel transport system substrate-binding protein
VIPRRRSLKLLALLTAFVLLFAACGGDDDDTTAAPEESTTLTTATDLQPGGTVTYASDQEPTGWNVNTSNDSLAALAWMEAIVLPSPYIIQPDFTVTLDENLMASAEQTSDDPQTITYTIAEEAAWNDGTPVSVDDFVYNWQMQNGSDPDVDVASTTGYDQIESVEAGTSDKEVVVTYAQPFADWQALFSNLMPAHILVDAAGWNDSLDGENVPEFSAGPFMFSAYEPGANVTLIPNDAYWGDPPLLDELVVRFGIDAPNVPAALENGEIDLAYPQPQIDLVQQVEALAPEIDSQINFGLTFEHLDPTWPSPRSARPSPSASTVRTWWPAPCSSSTSGARCSTTGCG